MAAVQSGADAVYILPRSNAQGQENTGLTDSELRSAVRYCRTRGCRAYISMEDGFSDDGLPRAAALARSAAALGAAALIVSDMGLARALKSAVPDMLLHGGAALCVRNIAGALAMKEIGFSRACLAPELDEKQISRIAAMCGMELEVLFHGKLCVSAGGQCYMSELLGSGSAWKGQCSQPCRLAGSLGGRMDDHPLSMKNVCLVRHIERLRQMGIACVRIGEMDLNPEYTAYLTELYSSLLRENRHMTPGEEEKLEAVFPPETVTDGYFTGSRTDMFLPPYRPGRETDKLLGDVRRNYTVGERRRVHVTFYALIRAGEPSHFAVEDADGNRIVTQGPVPQRTGSRGLAAADVEQLFYKTAGTPYSCDGVRCLVDPGLHMNEDDLVQARRELIAKLSHLRRAAVEPEGGAIPPLPVDVPREGVPELIFQVSTADQLTPELAELAPAMLYAPLTVLAEDFGRALPFADRGIPVCAVLPRVITDNEAESVRQMLRAVRSMGVHDAVINDMGHLFLARECGMSARGDYGLNVRNSFTMGILEDAGFLSATVSFGLNLSRIKQLAKPVDTEMIVYGRIPVMVTEHCIIKNSAGRCSCDNMNRLSDRRGGAFPVAKEFGCRNIIYNSRKLYLGDRQKDWADLGLKYVRLMFTGESDRECVQVAKGFMGLSGYRPNSLTRGMYYRGEN